MCRWDCAANLTSANPITLAIVPASRARTRCMRNCGSADSANSCACHSSAPCACCKPSHHGAGCSTQSRTDCDPLLTRRAGGERQPHESDNADSSHGFLHRTESPASQHQEALGNQMQAWQVMKPISARNRANRSPQGLTPAMKL